MSAWRAGAITAHRDRELARMLGHEPAPLAILDCVELGFIQPIDGAIRAEMSVFAHLIQRREARNMIRTMFLGKQAYDKAARDGGPAEPVTAAAAAIASAVETALAGTPDLALAGFGAASGTPVRERAGAGYWLDARADLRTALGPVAAQCAATIATLDEGQCLQLDHAVVRNRAIPAYLGGASGLAALEL
jgi:3-hydroxyacyl-CoA dehydrogenase/enoyl-CoA hydratase/3-hydroxybutyryl-CoA epimerase